MHALVGCANLSWPRSDGLIWTRRAGPAVPKPQPLASEEAVGYRGSSSGGLYDLHPTLAADDCPGDLVPPVELVQCLAGVSMGIERYLAALLAVGPAGRVPAEEVTPDS